MKTYTKIEEGFVLENDGEYWGRQHEIYKPDWWAFGPIENVIIYRSTDGGVHSDPMARLVTIKKTTLFEVGIRPPGIVAMRN